LIWAFSENAVALLVATLIYSMIILVIALRAEFSTRFAQQKLTATDLGDVFVDEDERWIWGVLYHNPNDSHFLVNDRIGIGMSVNLARPAAKVLMLLSALLLVAMPFFGVWMWVEEMTPVALVLTDTELIVRHTRDQYIIPLQTIESIELIEEMPYIITKENGASFTTLSKGRFFVSRYGSSYLCIMVNEPPFLIVKAGGSTYFLNDQNNNVTQGMYSKLTKR